MSKGRLIVVATSRVDGDMWARQYARGRVVLVVTGPEQVRGIPQGGGEYAVVDRPGHESDSTRRTVEHLQQCEARDVTLQAIGDAGPGWP